VLPLFLPVAVAVVAGDSIAGEAQAGTLRYLLVRPVGRTRLLVAKLVATLVFVLAAVLSVAVVGFGVGRLLLGSQPISQAIVSVSGTSLTPGQIAWRVVLAVGYMAFSMLGVAAMAVLLSTLSDSPLTASLGALAFLVASSLLLTIDAAQALQPYLPTRYWLSFVDLFRDPILWSEVERGVALQAVYVVVLLGAAWASFTTKDITS
jgi:ABC-2 type transport system permease protein